MSYPFGQIAEALSRNGYPVIPIRQNSKAPIEEGWTRYAHGQTIEQVQHLARRYASCGVGTVTSHIVGVDLDSLEAPLTAKLKALAVGIFGPGALERVGRDPKLLMVYKTEYPFSKIVSARFRRPGETISHRVEILGLGQQFVAYGIHPDTGAPYRWLNGGEPLNTPANQLPAITSEQAHKFINAVNTLMLSEGFEIVGDDRSRPGLNTQLGPYPSYLPSKPRTSLAAARAGMPNPLDGVTPLQLDDFLRHLAAQPDFAKMADAGRDEWLRVVFGFADAEQHGVAGARDLAEKWSMASPKWNQTDFDAAWRSFKSGGVTVRTLIDIGRKLGISPPWGRANIAPSSPAGLTTVVAANPVTNIPARLSPGAARAEMNSRFIFCHSWGGDTLIAYRQADGTYRAITEDQLRKMLANRRVAVNGDNSAEKLIPLADFWLRSPDRNEVDDVVFDPEGVRAPGGMKMLNLWSGFAVRPKRGDCSLIIRHIFEVICDRDRAAWRYLLRWLAHAVQRPGTAPGTVIVLRSMAEGAGKSLLLEVMRRIFGWHAVLLNTPEGLTGRFNEHLELVSFVGVNEPAFPGDHRQAAKMKSMITDSEWLIEGKYRKARSVANIAHIALTSNADWVVPAGNQARRFLVLDVAETRVGDRAYFEALWHQIENGGVEAFFHLLQRVPVTDSSLRDVPRTAALRRQQLQSADTTTRWAADAVASGELISQLGQGAPTNGGFGTRQSGRTLYHAYAAWCERMRCRPGSGVEFGRWLNRCNITSARSNGATLYDIPDAKTFVEAVLRQAGIR